MVTPKGLKAGDILKLTRCLNTSPGSVSIIGDDLRACKDAMQRIRDMEALEDDPKHGIYNVVAE